MAEDGPASSARASATDHEYTAYRQRPVHFSATSSPTTTNTSRQSTLDKSQFEVHMERTQTPMSQMGGHRGSHHILELDDYFVRLLSLHPVKFGDTLTLTDPSRSDHLIWTAIPSSLTSCACMAPCSLE